MIDIDKIRDEYISGNDSLKTLALANGLYEQGLDRHAAKGQWAKERRKFRQHVIDKASTSLQYKIARSVAKWDNDLLDMCNDTFRKLNDIINKPRLNKDGSIKELTILDMQRVADTLSKLNDIQRKTTDRDIQKIASVNVNYIEEMRNLLLGNDIKDNIIDVPISYDI
jgi:hypothetical protein